MAMEVDQVRQEEPGRNADFKWNLFDSASYHGHNYAKLHPSDLVFVKEIRDFFAAELKGGEGLHGVDVGAGANLYPSLAMLPFCAELTLIDVIGVVTTRARLSSWPEQQAGEVGRPSEGRGQKGASGLF